MQRLRRHWLTVILALSVLLRLVAAVYLGDTVEIMPGTFEQVSYHNLALRVLGGFGFSFDRQWWPLTAAGEPTAHWSYLYTFFLVVVYAVFGTHPLAARLIQALIVGLLQPWLTYSIGKSAFNEEVGVAAAFLSAIYTYFIYYSGTLMTEPLYITAILGTLYLAVQLSDSLQNSQTKNRTWLLAIGLGLFLGTVVLLRQLFLLFIPLLFLWTFFVIIKHPNVSVIKRFSLTTIISLGIVLSFIAPFTAYNYARFSRFVLLNTNAGFAFFWGNHPIYGTHFEDILPAEWGVTYQDLIPEEFRHLDEAALDQTLLKRGIGFVTDDPGRYIMLSLSRIREYFKFWPSPESSIVSNISRVFSFGIMWPFMLYGLCLTVNNKLTSERWLLIIFMLVYTGVHLASWAMIRYRLPVDAVLLIFAGVAIVDLVERYQARSHTSTV